MSITYVTLAREVDGKVEYVYPKTTASIVEYDKHTSIRNKIDKINKDIAEIDTRIDSIAEAMSFDETKEELLDIRVPSYNIITDGTTYESAGDSVRGQLDAVIRLVDAVKIDLKSLRKEYNESEQSVSTKIENLNKLVQTNKTNIENNATIIKNNSTAIENNCSIIEENKTIINNIAGSVIDTLEPEVMDIRVPNYNVVTVGTTYESAGDSVRGQFEAIITEIKSIKTDLEALQYTNINSQITAINELINTNKTNIENNTTNINNNSVAIANNTTNIENNTKSIEEIESDISSIQTSLSNITANEVTMTNGTTVENAITVIQTALNGYTLLAATSMPSNPQTNAIYFITE